MKRYVVTVLTDNLDTGDRSYDEQQVIAPSGREASNDVSNELSRNRNPRIRRTVQGVKDWRG